MGGVSSITNKMYANKYAENGFIPLTINIQTSGDGEEVLKNVPSFSTIKKGNYSNYINDKMKPDFYVIIY